MKKQCKNFPSCSRLTKRSSGYCDCCYAAWRRSYDESQSQAQTFYQSAEWKAVRARALQRDLHLCQICGDVGNTVDHIQKLKDRPDKKLAMDNLQTLCASCHARKDKTWMR